MQKEELLNCQAFYVEGKNDGVRLDHEIEGAAGHVKNHVMINNVFGLGCVLRKLDFHTTGLGSGVCTDQLRLSYEENRVWWWCDCTQPDADSCRRPGFHEMLSTIVSARELLINERSSSLVCSSTRCDAIYCKMVKPGGCATMRRAKEQQETRALKRKCSKISAGSLTAWLDSRRILFRLIGAPAFTVFVRHEDYDRLASHHEQKELRWRDLRGPRTVAYDDFIE